MARVDGNDSPRLNLSTTSLRRRFAIHRRRHRVGIARPHPLGSQGNGEGRCSRPMMLENRLPVIGQRRLHVAAPTREESRDIRHLGDRARPRPILKRTAHDEIGNRASSVRQPLPHDRPQVSLRKFAKAIAYIRRARSSVRSANPSSPPTLRSKLVKLGSPTNATGTDQSINCCAQMILCGISAAACVAGASRCASSNTSISGFGATPLRPARGFVRRCSTRRRPRRWRRPPRDTARARPFPAE